MASKYTKEFLEPIVMESKSLAEVARKIGRYFDGGKPRTAFRNQVISLGINIDHLTKNGRPKGITVVTKRYSNQEVFVKNSPLLRSGSGSKILKNRLISIGFEYRCQICGNAGLWNDKPLTLHLDHIDGNNTNNELTNLRFLCPNCHQQTDNWGSRNARKETNETNQ